jgi:hypothetical protein
MENDLIRRAVLAELGRMGGHARARKLSRRRRLEIARNASAAATRKRKRGKRLKNLTS